MFTIGTIATSFVRRLRRRATLLRRAFNTALLLTALPAAAAPNIIVVLTDDLNAEGAEQLIAEGYLPNIKNYVVDQGVSFRRAYVTNSECCPSRATLLTGRYAHNHGVLINHALDPTKGGIGWPGWLSDGVNPGAESQTIAVWLRAAGYRTGYVGKYLNGYGDTAPPNVADPRTYVPPGWDSWNALLAPTEYQVYDFDVNQNGVPTRYSGTSNYQTDVLGTRAALFVRDSLARNKPFFLVFAPLAPHVEVNIDTFISGNSTTGAFDMYIRPPPRHARLIDGDPSNGEFPFMPIKPSFNELDVTDKPSCPRSPPLPGPVVTSFPYCVQQRPVIGTLDQIARLNLQRKSMLTSVMAVDDVVGGLARSLESVGALSNTVIIFMSDNGWFYGEHRLSSKELAYEESIRIPLYIRSPGGRAGVVSNDLVINNDLAPTLAALGGVTAPYEMDGSSLEPLLSANPTSSWFNRRRFLVERWYVPSLLKYDGPGYLALRAFDPTNNIDFTYIGTRADPSAPAQFTHQEMYDNTQDPYQLASASLPSTVTTNLNNFLALFGVCRGAQCKALESF